MSSIIDIWQGPKYISQYILVLAAGFFGKIITLARRKCWHQEICGRLGNNICMNLKLSMFLYFFVKFKATLIILVNFRMASLTVFVRVFMVFLQPRPQSNFFKKFWPSSCSEKMRWGWSRCFFSLHTEEDLKDLWRVWINEMDRNEWMVKVGKLKSLNE